MITTAQATIALRLAQDALIGAQQLGTKWKEDSSLVAITALALLQAVSLLDLFLIRRREVLDLRRERDLQICKFLAGAAEAACTLSDRKTQLVLQWPTPENNPVSLKSKSKSVLSKWNDLILKEQKRYDTAS
jgi:hypothetical protein